MVDGTNRRKQLSPMQRRVVRLCTLGCTVNEAARILGISPHTAERHKHRAMERAEAHGIAQLTRYALRQGISYLDDALTEEEEALKNKTSDDSTDAPAKLA